MRNYLRTTIRQDGWTSVAILSVDHEFAGKMSYEGINGEFVSLKTRKANFTPK